MAPVTRPSTRRGMQAAGRGAAPTPYGDAMNSRPAVMAGNTAGGSGGTSSAARPKGATSVSLPGSPSRSYTAACWHPTRLPRMSSIAISTSLRCSVPCRRWQAASSSAASACADAARRYSARSAWFSASSVATCSRRSSFSPTVSSFISCLLTRPRR